MKLNVRENYTIQLEEVFDGIVIKTTDGVEFHICQRDYGIEVTCNGITKHLDEGTFNTNVMKNITVKKLIGMLKNMNPDAVVCMGENVGFSDAPRMEYSSIENCVEVKNTSYIDDAGDEVVGDIVFFA